VIGDRVTELAQPRRKRLARPVAAPLDERDVAHLARIRDVVREADEEERVPFPR
jgi:hypothetical protein